MAVVCITLVVVAISNANRNAKQATVEAELPPLATTTQASPSASASQAIDPSSSVGSSSYPSTKAVTSPVESSKTTMTTRSTAAPVSTVSKPPSTTPKAPSPSPIQSVLAAPPTHMTISAKPGFKVNAIVDGMDYRDDLAAPSCSTSPDPECPQKAYWIQNRLGVAPSSSCSENPGANDSTYIMGHSWTQDPRVFDELSDYAMKHYDSQTVNGAVVLKITPMGSTDPNGKPLPDVETWSVSSLLGSPIVVTTGKGTLTYAISKAYIVLKSDVGRTDEFRQGTGCQLIIDTCGIDLSRGVDTNYAVILFAELKTAVPH